MSRVCIKYPPIEGVLTFSWTPEMERCLKYLGHLCWTEYRALKFAGTGFECHGEEFRQNGMMMMLVSPFGKDFEYLISDHRTGSRLEKITGDYERVRDWLMLFRLSM